MGRKRYYYHATETKNIKSIIEEGLHTGFDGVIYLADSPENAAKFLAIRLIKDIVVLELKLDEDKIEESFDHNEAFFKCKAYMYPEDVQLKDIIFYRRYEL